MSQVNDQPRIRPDSHSRRTILLVTAGYLALALLLLTPPLLGLDSELIGYPNCTNRMHVWVLWVVNQILFQGYSPIHTNYIFFPTGANLVLLYGSDLFYPVVLSPLVALLSAGVVFNLKLIFSFTVGPLGAFLMIRHIGAGRRAAWVGGALYMAAPYFLLETFNGVSELVAMEWIPFTILYLMRTLRSEGSKKDALLCALFAMMSAYSSGYNIFFLFFIGVILVIARLISHWKSVPWRRLVLMGLVCGVGMIPLGLLHREGQTSTRVQEEHMDMFDAESTPRMDSSAALVRFFRPGRNNIPWTKTYGDGTVKTTNTTYTVYLGYGVLALALLALFLRRPGAWLWGAASLFFVLICLGPHLWVTEERLLIFGKIVPMPGLLLYKILPGFDVTVRHSYRYVAMAHLCLAVLSAMGLQWILDKASSSMARWGITAAAMAVCLGEVLLIGPAPWPLPRTSTRVPAYYTELAQEEGDFPIIELPYSDFLEHLQPILMAQTVHGKKLIAGAVHHRLGEEELRLMNKVPLALNWLRDDDITRPLDNSQIALSVKVLQAAGFRYVVVRDGDFESKERAREVHEFLTDIFGEPAPKPGLIKVYDVGKANAEQIMKRGPGDKRDQGKRKAQDREGDSGD